MTFLETLLLQAELVSLSCQQVTVCLSNSSGK